MRREELTHWEELAKLSLSEEERETLALNTDRLLALCRTLSELSPEEGSLMTDAASVTREDTPSPCLERDALLESAPTHKDGLITIP